MKFSISVPDGLWSALHREGDSPSQLVQEALQLLAQQREQGDGQLLPSAAGTYFARGGGGDEDLPGSLDRLALEALTLRQLGYQIGVEAATKRPWHELDRLGDVMALARRLQENWLEQAEDDDPLAEQVAGFVGDYHPDAMYYEGSEEPLASPTLFLGAATGILEVRDEVRKRMATLQDVQTSGHAQEPAR
jgi:hypothetical protein